MNETPENLARQVRANADQIAALQMALQDFAFLMMMAANVPDDRQLKIADRLRAMPPTLSDDAENAARAQIAFEIRNLWADTIERLILK